jgi:hypothetical protein
MDAPPACSEDLPMEPLEPARHEPPQLPADPRLQAMLDLKREMESLHVQLEYLRLLLKMGVGVR